MTSLRRKPESRIYCKTGVKLDSGFCRNDNKEIQLRLGLQDPDMDRITKIKIMIRITITILSKIMIN